MARDGRRRRIEFPRRSTLMVPHSPRASTNPKPRPYDDTIDLLFDGRIPDLRASSGGTFLG